MDQQSIKDTIDSCIESLVDKMFLVAHDELDTPFNRKMMRVLIIDLRFGKYALDTLDMRILEKFKIWGPGVASLFIHECHSADKTGIHVKGLHIRDVWTQHLLPSDRLQVFSSWITGTTLLDAMEHALHNRKAIYKKSIIDRVSEIDDPAALFMCWDIVKGDNDND